VEVGGEERILVGDCLVFPTLVVSPAPEVDREWMGSWPCRRQHLSPLGQILGLLLSIESMWRF
jgi:hypothetical protein